MRRGINTRHSLTFLSLGVLFLAALTVSSCTGADTEELEQRDQHIKELQSDVDQLKQEIAEKEKAIENLERQNAELQNRVLDPEIVQEGDNHWKIAYDYLTEEKGVPSEEAERILARAVLFDPILEGYRAWNFSDGEAYGGFFTQNDAPASPGLIARRAASEIEEERASLETRVAELQDAMGEQRQELTAKLQEMERLRQEAETANRQLETQVTSLKDQVASLRERNDALDSRLNSVYYLAGSKEALETQGKIEDPLFGQARIGAVSSSDFERRLDLRKTQIIELEAADLGLPSVEDIKLLPQGYAESVDYRVDIGPDRQSAEVHLLNEGKFRLASIVLVVD
jgi:hypothetical protein